MQTRHCRKEIGNGDAFLPQWHSIPHDKFHHSCNHKCHEDKIWHSGTCCQHSITKKTNKLGPKHHKKETDKNARHRNDEPKNFSSEHTKCKEVVIIQPPVPTLREPKTDLNAQRKVSETYMTVPLPAESTDSDCVREIAEKGQRVTKNITKGIEPKQVDVILPTGPLRVKLNFTNNQNQDQKGAKSESKQTPKVKQNIIWNETSASKPPKLVKPTQASIVKQRTIIDQYKEYLEHTQPSTRNWKPPSQGPVVYLINLLYSPIEWLKFSIFGHDKKKAGAEALIPHEDDDPEFVEFLRTYDGCPCMVSTLRKLFNEGKAKNSG